MILIFINLGFSWRNNLVIRGKHRYMRRGEGIYQGIVRKAVTGIARGFKLENIWRKLGYS
tara:strand:+ start:325 stop:504 length:180 start_codon:yes stop_codon:yes gene_type:complete